MDMIEIEKSVHYVSSMIKEKPDIAVILGSGLGELAQMAEDKTVIKFEDVPNMPASTVKGHAGQFVCGKIKGRKVFMMQGRIHYYEGNKMESIALPIYIMKKMGINKLIVTNAAGGVNTEFKPGDLMIIRDHINFAFNNPLIGKNDEKIGPRFPDMSQAYDRQFIDAAEKCSKDLNIEVKEGTYCMMPGPSYETPAEVRMVRILGGDAVGMSTVPEVIAAAHCGMRVLGISCITNMACGILNKPLSHKEVIETSEKVKNKFTSLISEIINRI